MNRLILCLLFFAFVSTASAQFDANYDESKVPEFKLPDPLKMFNGKKIRNSKKVGKKSVSGTTQFFYRKCVW